MAVMMGVGIGLPGTFLRPYASTLGILTIGLFFGAYASTAFVTRLATHRLPTQIGLRATILLGMASLVLSMLLYPCVNQPWQLALPGVAAGVAHALLFPSVVAGGSHTFPMRYRGLGTTVVLAMFDVGNLVGMPMAGSIVFLSQRSGLPPYITMYLGVAVLVTAVSGYFAWAPPPDRPATGRRPVRGSPSFADSSKTH